MHLPFNVTAEINILYLTTVFDYSCVCLSCNRVSLQNVSVKCERDTINKSNKWKQGEGKAGWLHIQQPRWDVMMPVSQLVVLVSYNFWVQLVGSDLGQWWGILIRERSRVNRKVEIAARRAADEAVENGEVSTWHLWATCSFLRTFHHEDRSNLLLLGCY